MGQSKYPFLRVRLARPVLDLLQSCDWQSRHTLWPHGSSGRSRSSSKQSGHSRLRSSLSVLRLCPAGRAVAAEPRTPGYAEQECRHRLPAEQNASPHSSHAYGLFVWCSLSTWARSPPAVWKAPPHVAQLCSLARCLPVLRLRGSCTRTGAAGAAGCAGTVAGGSSICCRPCQSTSSSSPSL